MDRRTLQTASALVVLVPLIYGTISGIINLYDHWAALVRRVEAVERRQDRLKCKLGSNPPESIDWKRDCSTVTDSR